MKMRKAASAVATSLGLVVGFAALAGASPVTTISGTGPDSYNKVKNRVHSYVKVENNNCLSASNYNTQTAWSGDAKVYHNTTGGDAMSGAAMNSNSLNASATVNNAASGAWSSAVNVGGGNATTTIDNTGPDSHNIVDNQTSVKVHVENNNNLSVTNTNTQSAYSGDATVSHNTTGGSAVTGDATNTNSTSVNFNVTN